MKTNTRQTKHDKSRERAPPIERRRRASRGFLHFSRLDCDWPLITGHWPLRRIAGGYSLTDISSSTTTNWATDTNQTDTSNSTAMEYDNSTTTETGNEVTGDFSRVENGSSSGTLWNHEYNQSQMTSISQNETGTTSASETGNNVTGSNSGFSTDTNTVSLYPAETNIGDMVGPPQLSVTASETGTPTFNRKCITGDRRQCSHEFIAVLILYE